MSTAGHRRALLRASARAHNLVSDLESARNLARDLVSDLDVDNVRDLESARNLARDLVSDLEVDNVTDLARDLALTTDRVLTDGPAFLGVRDLASDLDRALDRARTIVSDRSLASERERALVRAATYGSIRGRSIARRWALDELGDRARAFDHARTLASELKLARTIVSTLNRDLDRARTGSAQRQHGTGRVAPSAGHLLAAAARLLPATDRARYAEEYRSELWEIARAGQPRRRQIGYAARQAASSLRLRAELRTPRRRKASP